MWLTSSCLSTKILCTSWYVIFFISITRYSVTDICVYTYIAWSIILFNMYPNNVQNDTLWFCSVCYECRNHIPNPIGGITRTMERNYIWPFSNISFQIYHILSMHKKYVYLEVDVGVFSFTLGEIFISKWAIFDGVSWIRIFTQLTQLKINSTSCQIFL